MIYYVYELINSLDDKVFYVGKGKKRRMYIHENRAKHPLPIKGENLKLRNKILSIWKKGGKIIYNQIFFSDSSFDAYTKETERIKEMGLDNLCNLIIYPLTPEECYAHHSKQMIGRHLSDVTKSKIRNSLLGHEVKTETREKIRLKKLGTLNPCSEQKRINISNSKKPVGGFKDVKSPSGEIMSINILSDFCKTHRLTTPGLSELLSGKRKIHRGWVLSDCVVL